MMVLLLMNIVANQVLDVVGHQLTEATELFNAVLFFAKLLLESEVKAGTMSQLPGSAKKQAKRMN